MYFSKSNLTNYTAVWSEPLSPLEVPVNRQRHFSEVSLMTGRVLVIVEGVTYIFLSCDRPLNAPVASSTERSLLLRRLRRSQSREQTRRGRSTNIISWAASLGMCVFVCIHAVWVQRHMSTQISIKCTVCVCSHMCVCVRLYIQRAAYKHCWPNRDWPSYSAFIFNVGVPQNRL